MKKVPSPLIRHEAAFSFGSNGTEECSSAFDRSSSNDPSEIVRHESAAALGAIGDERAREALQKASKDSSDEVRGLAIASLFNLDFISYSKSRQQRDAEKLAAEIQEKRELAANSPKKRMPHP